ncbi:TonB-dependent receptor [Pontibacter sp. G13]|uniref:SusC/RagA family TonB-linked outer membrane protein n=1 Tax=Pontibacter sp. G13 TaxID=3074898 RepID=UPI002888FC3D|nr:TonB-dependent receptor [Pontibacter sp. G13]WNJ19137.1 TonB-dependent receptor [Pontibacter sp. G13]
MATIRTDALRRLWVTGLVIAAGGSLFGQDLAMETPPLGDLLTTEATAIYFTREADSRTITGTVTAADTKTPLAGATVRVKDATIGAFTDDAGNFSLEAPDNATTLLVSFIGYQELEVSIEGVNVVSIMLEPDNTFLDEVVVVGYGSLQKKDVTGSIERVTPDNFNKGVVFNVGTLLQGKVAGLTIAQTGSDPTSAPSVQLRGPSTLGGNTSPLYVVDGVPGVDLGTIAPEDIVSVDVMKDAASTAIYGTRAANGVILITTRRGEANQAFVKYNGYVSAQHIANRVEVADAAALKGYLSSQGIQLAEEDDLRADTDWQDEITRTGLSHNHNLSFGGGTAKTRYYASLTYFNQEGIALNSGNERLLGRINVDNSLIDDRLKLSFSLANQRSVSQLVNYDAFYQAMRYLPTAPVYNEDGTFYERQRQEYFNPVAMLEQERRVRKYAATTATGKASLEIIDGLNFEVNGSLQQTHNYFTMFIDIDAQNSVENNRQGYARKESYMNTKKILETYLNFDRDLGRDMNLKLLAGYSFQEDQFSEGLEAQDRDFLTNELGFQSLGSGSQAEGFTLAGQNGLSRARIVSFFGRGVFSFSDKYVLQASIRRDGSSRFGENNKWGIFPAVSAAWNISNEDFMKGSMVSDLKLRAGYGVSGFQGIGTYQSLRRYGIQGRAYDNGQWINTYFIAQNPNPDLKWERTATTNVGVDFGFFNNRLRGSLDIYDKRTSDMLALYDVPVPPFPRSTILANAGSMKNQGIELYIESDIVRKGNFNWNSGLNFARNVNTLLSLSNDLFEKELEYTGAPSGQGLVGQTTQILEPGQSIGTFYTLKYVGADASGAHLFETASGEQVTAANTTLPEDNQYLGNALPDFTFGWNNSLRYGNWGLSFMLRGMVGHDILNALSANLARLPEAASYNPSMAAIENGNPDNPIFSSYFIEDGTYLRLDNATLSHTLPGGDIFKGATVYVTGQNLFTLTNYSGVDPEINLNSLEPGIQGVRNSDRSYFQARTITLGANFSF